MFRRKSSHSPADLISSFWAWWSSAAPRFEAAIDTGEYGALSDEMSERVHAIDPGLQWEFSKGRNSKHLLCVTSAGNPEVRAAAHRWRMAAPPATGMWEYASARTGDPSAMTNRLEIAGHDVPLELTRFDVQIDEERQEIDLVVFHPAFAAMSDDERGQVMFLIADWTLGEEGVERWVGAIETTDCELTQPLSPEAVVEIVDSLAARHSEVSWAIFEATSPTGHPALIMAMRPLKPVDYPLLDQLGEIRHPFKDQTAEGLPQPNALDELRAFEEALEGVAPDHSRLAAIITCDGVRTFNIYCDSQSTASAEIDAWLRSARRVDVEWSMDPAWSAVRPFR